MKYMKDKIFIDTNLLVYYISDDIKKKKIVHELLLSDAEIIISSQVISEFISVCLKKLKLPKHKTLSYAEEFIDIFSVTPINLEVVSKALSLVKKNNFSIWDSLIVSSALHAECKILYTEDMQHGQIIAKKLRIINPFE